MVQHQPCACSAGLRRSPEASAGAATACRAAGDTEALNLGLRAWGGGMGGALAQLQRPHASCSAACLPQKAWGLPLSHRMGAGR